MKDLASHLLDILQNSIVAGATLIQLDIAETVEGVYSVIFTDNGKGMDEEMVQRVTDPFTTSRTTRKVGLGLPLLKTNAERTGGNLQLQSQLGKGTTVKVLFNYKNIDMLPSGDIAGTLSLTFTSYPEIDFEYRHITPHGVFELKTAEIKQALEGVPINDPQVIRFIKEMIAENLNEIKAY